MTRRNPVQPNADRPATCRKCGADLPVTRGRPGRPRLYCGEGCRRATEYELRRLQDALADAEKQSRAVRLALAEDDFYNGLQRNKARKRGKFWEAEIGRLEVRLRSLLDDDAPAVGNSPEAPTAGVKR